MTDSAVHEDSQDQTSTNPTLDAETLAANAAIDEAQQYALNAMQAGDLGAKADDLKPIARQELSEDERRLISRAAAKKQRQMGLQELEKIYPSTMVVNTPVVINDPGIASSATRFLGLVDKTIYLINRFGFRYHDEDSIEVVRENLSELIKAYCEEAAVAVKQGQELAQRAKEKIGDDMWLAPTYTTHTLNIEFAVKARDTISMIRALKDWDRAIIEFSSLEFNDAATIGQIDILRQRERQMFYAISKLCFRITRGFWHRKQNAEKPAEGQ